jgi:hypothetical protein
MRSLAVLRRLPPPLQWTQCGLDADIVSLSVPTPVPESVQSRLVKSRMWDLAQPDPSVQSLIFIDGCGALFTSSVAPMLQSAAQLLGLTSAPGISSVVRLAVAQNVSAPTTQDSYDRVWMVRRIGSQQILSAYRQQVGRPTLADDLNILDPPVDHAVCVTVQASAWHSHRSLLALLHVTSKHSSPPPHAHASQTLRQGATSSEQAILRGAAQAVDPSCHDSADECLQQVVPAVARYDFMRPLQCEGGHEGCRFLEEKPAIVTLLDRTCESLDRRIVNKFVARSLDLCSLQGVDQALCVNPFMSLFLNPWVPFPRCAKVGRQAVVQTLLLGQMISKVVGLGACHASTKPALCCDSLPSTSLRCHV